MKLLPKGQLILLTISIVMSTIGLWLAKGVILMRETFPSVYSLLGYYRFIKCDVLGLKALILQKEPSSYAQFNARAVQSRQEEKFCFIADVENFVRFFEGKQGGWRKITTEYLLPIFHLRYTPESAQYKSYRHMANCMRRKRLRGDNIPLRLQYQPHLSDLAQKMDDMVADYFTEKGFIGDT
jgi:hypothetical protein